MITYRATLDVPRELAQYLGRLLHAERRDRGTRKGTRALTCYWHAVFALRWFRRHADITVLAERAPDLHETLQRAKNEGLAHVILDGKVFSAERLAEKTTSVQGEQIDLWYSGKTHEPGGNIQALLAPNGFPLWVSNVEPGSVHDLTAAREHVLGALYWAYSQLDLPTPSDNGYDGAGIGVFTPVKQPADGQVLDVGTRTYNALLRGLRCLGERGFALLTGRWRALRHFTTSPRKIGHVVKAALVLTHFEHRRLT